MPLAQTNRDRLRSGLLGPLGEETTDMLMDALDAPGLRDHIDQRFQQADQRFDQVDQRFEQVDKRFDQLDRRLDRFEDRIDSLTDAIVQSGRDSNRLTYTICAAMIVLGLTTLVQIVFAR